MTPNLTASSLRAIAEALESLAKIKARVSTIDVDGLHVRVQRHDDQRDGAHYTVLSIEGITRAEVSDVD